MKRRVHVRLGSRNAAKLHAVEIGLAPFFDEVRVSGSEVTSGVDEQPLGFEEIVSGARNRAHASWGAGTRDLAVGIEDGLVQVPATRTGWVNIGCCVIYDGVQDAMGFSAGFEYPPACVSAATGIPRTPVGTAFEALFAPPPGWPAPRPDDGNIGSLTGGHLSRAGYAAQAVTCAYVRLLHPGLYEDPR